MRVLIVEDEPVIAMEIETIVLDRVPDAEIVFATSVGQAREAVDGSLDVAFLDIDVTDGKTYGVAFELRALNIPFVFVSAGVAGDAPGGLASENFIPKPFAPVEIIETIEALAKKRG